MPVLLFHFGYDAGKSAVELARLIEPLNDQDRLLQAVRGDRNALMASVEALGSLGAPNDLLLRWDIILASG